MNTHVLRSCFCTAILSAGSIAAAQFQTDLVAGFQASNRGPAGQPSSSGQIATDAWSFRRGSPTGPLMPAIISPSFIANYWGSPDRAFNVPLCGPIFSHTPGQNEVNFYDRLPSFTGIFMHPDVGLDVFSVLSPQAPITITSLSGLSEVLGDLSNGVTVSVEARIGTSSVTVVPATAVNYGPNSVPLIATSGVLPLSLNTGDALWVRVAAGGAAAEDWCSVQLSLQGAGVLIIAGPRDTAGCVGATSTLSVTAVGSAARHWQVFDASLPGWRNLLEGETLGPTVYSGVTTSQLSIAGVTAAAAGQYRCVVGAVPSAAASLALCLADFNCDGQADPDDLGDYINCYFSTPPCSRADVNADGDTNPDDLGDFINVYFAGCS